MDSDSSPKADPSPDDENTRFEDAGRPHHGLYIHIPFCLKKCAYCDFYSLTDLTLRQPFVEALIQEINMLSKGIPCDSLYLGGGTPSVLTHHQIEMIMQQVCNRVALAPDVEITMEVNPGTVSKSDLDRLKQAGINRINIGVQSFDQSLLEYLGRIHSPEDALVSIQHAREAGFDNIGLDLIFGIPGQEMSAWQETLSTAVSFSPEHLSCYMLTFETGTLLHRQRKEPSFQELPEKHIVDLFQITQQILDEAGYEQYEISNFARIQSNGFSLRSRHNQKYWSVAPYIGLGPSAHSYLPPTRYWNIRDVKKYIHRLAMGRSPLDGKEETTLYQQLIEAIYLGLRTSEGIDIIEFEERFQQKFIDIAGHVFEEMSKDALLTLVNGRCALTAKGMLFHESIAARFIAEVPEELSCLPE